MLLGPHEIARRVEYEHPGWCVWYGRNTRQYWALARWVDTPHAMLGAATPQALTIAITMFETFHPPTTPARPNTPKSMARRGAGTGPERSSTAVPADADRTAI